MALAQLETISPIKFGDSFPHMSGDTQPYVITCEGDDCTSVEFYNTTKGCNPILKLCPACNAKVKSAVDGKPAPCCFNRVNNCNRQEWWRIDLKFKQNCFYPRS